MRRILLALGLLALCYGEAGATCGALPFTFVNGTLANATQVNQNFTALLNCINGTSITTLGTVTTGTWHASVIDQTYGGTNVAGGWTAGSVIFQGGSSAFAQNNALLFWDNSNGRLGIGTATPAYTLDVSSFTANAGNWQLVGNSVSGGGSVGFTNSNGPRWEFYGTSHANAGLASLSMAGTSRLQVSNAGALRLLAYGAGALYTDGSGNVSAGTLAAANGGTGATASTGNAGSTVLSDSPTLTGTLNAATILASAKIGANGSGAPSSNLGLAVGDAGSGLGGNSGALNLFVSNAQVLGLSATSIVSNVSMAIGTTPGANALNVLGNINATTYSVGASGGSTCAGAPGASFRVTSGIVTTC